MSKQSTQAVSPVIAVILMVATTVILSAAVGTLVFNLGQSNTGSTNPTAGVDVSPNPNGTVTVQLTTKGSASEIIVQNSGGLNQTLTEIGQTITIPTGGDSITILSSEDGEKQVIQTYKSNSDYVMKNIYDTFEDGDLDEYSLSGTPTIQKSIVHSGTYAVEIAEGEEAVSSSGLPNYPEAGDSFEYWTYMNPDGDAPHSILQWGVQPDGNHFKALVVRSGSTNYGELRLGAPNGDSDADGVGSSKILNWNEWYRVTVDWYQNGTNIVTVYNESGAKKLQGSVTDAGNTTGAIELNSYSSGSGLVYFDDWKKVE